MNISNRKLLFIAIIFALLASSATYYYIAKIEQASKVVEPTQDVVIAKVTIPSKTEITMDMLEVKSYKLSAAPPSTYQSIDEVVGQVTKETIYNGEPIIHERMADENYKKNHLSYSVPDGYRAVTLQYNPVMGVGNFVQPGDYVDVIGTYDEKVSPTNADVSKIILQKVLVLAVGPNTGIDLEQKNATDIQTITLAVTPKEAEKLVFTEERASVRLMLRPLNEETKPTTTGASKTNIFAP